MTSRTSYSKMKFAPLEETKGEETRQEIKNTMKIIVAELLKIKPDIINKHLN